MVCGGVCIIMYYFLTFVLRVCLFYFAYFPVFFFSDFFGQDFDFASFLVLKQNKGEEKYLTVMVL